MRPQPATLLLVLVACAAPPAQPGPVSEEELATLAEARLRSLFPELEGPLSREAIRAALAAEHEGARPAGLRELERALATDDLEEAHELVCAILRPRLVERASRLGREAGPREALVWIERAERLGPPDPELLRLRGESALAIGLAEGERRYLEDALASFRAAAGFDGGARALVGASRAALALGRAEEALALARAALAPGGPALEAGLALAAQRALCEAAFDDYAKRAREAGSRPPDERQRFESTQRALEDYLARAPREAWAHERLAALHELAGDPKAARERLVAGLLAAPEEPSLHERLASSARALGGRAALLESYERVRAAHPSSPAVLYHVTRERLDEALEELRSKRDASALLSTLEREFARCRALGERWSEPALEGQILCRNALGWTRLAAGRLAEAHEAFLSSDDLSRGRGLLLDLPGRLESGVRGLAAVAEASSALGADPNSLERATHVERACKIFDFLHAYQPESLDWAEEAGFHNRDAAVLFEQRARALASQGELDQADRLLARAREMMEQAYRAYVDACELAPDDLRVQTEAARVLVLYLQRDVGEAERMLARAVALGAERLPALRANLAAAPDERRERLRQELEALEIAYGDACEQLGVLHLTLKNDPRTARRWFERALAEGGPDPRPSIDGKTGDGKTGEGQGGWPNPWLEQCARAEAGELGALGRERARWAAPIARGAGASR